jgi:hypothetical protein
VRPEDRQALVRRHFEVMRDLTWWEDLQPKFKAYGVDAEEMKSFREAWNLHAEKKDWGWWQQEAARYSYEKIQDMLMDAVERADAVGTMQWRQEQEQAGHSEYKQMIADASKRSIPQDKERERDR